MPMVVRYYRVVLVVLISTTAALIGLYCWSDEIAHSLLLAGLMTGLQAWLYWNIGNRFLTDETDARP